jgi:hypothetical protein
MKKTNAGLLFLVSAALLSAQPVLITSFDSPVGGSVNGSWSTPVDQFSYAAGVMTIGPVSGGNPDDSGSFAFAPLAAALDGSNWANVAVTARIDSGNSAPGFTINFYDGAGNGVYTTSFLATSFSMVGFTTVMAAPALYPSPGDTSDIQYFGIGGSGLTNPIRISFDGITVSAIPEPGTYAAIFGALALGLAGLRRRLFRP